jgi:hypothetical protein
MIQFFKAEDRAGITSDEFQDLTKSFKRSAVHLETRDAYGTATELPYMAKWAAGLPIRAIRRAQFDPQRVQEDA